MSEIPRHLAEPLDVATVEVLKIVRSRGMKYGPENIAKHGMLGIIVRLGDKLARLEYSQANHEDESLEDTLIDIAGYALIGLLWVRGEWPGSERAADVDDSGQERSTEGVG